MRRTTLIIAGTALALVAGGIAFIAWPDEARLDLIAVTGAQPRITAAREQIWPTIGIADATGWAAGRTPIAAQGLKVAPFAAGLEHPRWLYRLPNGDILVAETNSPPRTGAGIADWIMERLLDKAGALVPSPNRITLLRDADGDGLAESRSTFLTGINSPLGMALVGDALYIANSDALVRYRYAPGQTRITGKPETILTYPSEGHWARNVIASADGRRLYVSVGSGSNVGEGGMAAEKDRASIWEVDPATRRHRIFAAGLRNPNGMAIEPHSGRLWTVVNERDMLGSDLVPDYLTSVSAGDHFGWPWYYWGRHRDTRVEPDNPAVAAKVRTPDYALGPHVAALGLSFAQDARLGSGWSDGAFIGLHGSWNRKPLSGYKVVHVPFGNDGKPLPGAPMQDVLTGFLDREGRAQGRPVGVITDATGALLVADDVGDVVWRVTPAQKQVRIIPSTR